MRQETTVGVPVFALAALTTAGAQPVDSFRETRAANRDRPGHRGGPVTRQRSDLESGFRSWESGPLVGVSIVLVALVWGSVHLGRSLRSASRRRAQPPP